MTQSAAKKPRDASEPGKWGLGERGVAGGQDYCYHYYYYYYYYYYYFIIIIIILLVLFCSLIIFLFSTIINYKVWRLVLLVVVRGF